VLKDLSDGLQYLTILYGLLELGRIRTIHPNKELMQRSYAIAGRNKAPIYDTVFVALALESDLELMTFDNEQVEMLRSELKR
jgi:predicted nucleic acid-binding protein